ncbi:hypothetical protein [Planococcus lenghuensis]|uniref:Phospholipase C/D domain-containing protein n=1 Tax=Planococcus lenghuensis TaxID=2213202 RepID=A0A1Q2L533_9BACL|nr:hypothetical protein [Planococcus lenghuensis]AQQ55558.1 hypothetical protein B0X71_20505 [Planococcus lenghuensis]
MGSRIMHLIIADRVSEKLSIQCKGQFLLGGIAPDAAFTRERKTKSHYYEGSLEDGTRCVNYERFAEKYPVDIQSEYGLGYLIHLIADDVWMKHIYFKNNFKNRLDADPGLLDRWHSDFRKLNGKLIEWFECGDLEDELRAIGVPENNISEIESEDLEKFKEETINDFFYTEDDLKKELEVYSLKQILSYINLAVEEIINFYMAVTLRIS